MEKFTPNGIMTSKGEIPLDIVILATGFDIEKSLKAFPITGTNGQDLAESFGDAPSAYKGSSFVNSQILGAKIHL